MPALAACQLTRRFAAGLALDHVTFELPEGEVLALLGPNGAGKTTTVRLLNGILRPDEGSATVAGFDPFGEVDKVRRRTGVLTENAGLDDRLTSRENLEVTARLRGYDRRAARARVEEMLARFGMADRADDLTQGFSTGQRKRVALARALLHDPEVLFLDEPTSGLDPAGTRDVIDLIQGLAGQGRTIVLATHFLDGAGRLADRMAVLHRGQLRAFGRPEDLARDLWPGIAVRLDLGGPVDAGCLAALASRPGVLDARSTLGGAELRVRDRAAVPPAVADLVDAAVPVFEVQVHAPSLEDVYFEIEARIQAADGGQATDGFLSGDRVPAAGRHGAALTLEEGRS